MSEPITREEKYLATIAGEYNDDLPQPVTRSDKYLKKIAENGGGGGGSSQYSIECLFGDGTEHFAVNEPKTFSGLNDFDALYIGIKSGMSDDDYPYFQTLFKRSEKWDYVRTIISSYDQRCCIIEIDDETITQITSQGEGGYTNNIYYVYGIKF